MRFARFRPWTMTCVAVAVWMAPGFSRQQTPPEPPVQLVRETVRNETDSSNGSFKYMFCDLKQTPSGSETKLTIETRDAMAGMLIAINGKPLTADQKKAEQDRVERFVKNPDELKKKQKQEHDSNERVLKIMKALPDAFLYEYAGTQEGTENLGARGHELERLKFRPNPKYEPPSRVEQVLTGMAGVMLIDKSQHRIALIDGTLEKEVSFGWGIFGHLDPGGRFVVQQGDLDNGHWEITRMDLSFTGKILLFKNLKIQSNETFTDFHRVPANLTFAQGLELLKKHSSELEAGSEAKNEH